MFKPATRLIAFATALVSSIAVGSAARAAWPARVFAPYMFLGAGDKFKLTDCDDACGQKFYTLAFIIAQQEGRGASAEFKPVPTWNGHTPMPHDDPIRVRALLREQNVVASAPVDACSAGSICGGTNMALKWSQVVIHQSGLTKQTGADASIVAIAPENAQPTVGDGQRISHQDDDPGGNVPTDPIQREG